MARVISADDGGFLRFRTDEFAIEFLLVAYSEGDAFIQASQGNPSLQKHEDGKRRQSGVQSALFPCSKILFDVLALLRSIRIRASILRCCGWRSFGEHYRSHSE